MNILAFLLALVPQVSYQRPPNHEYVLRATVPSDVPIKAVNYPSECRLVVKTPRVYELTTLVPAGVSTVQFTPGRDSSPSRITGKLAWLTNPNAVVLDVDGVNFPLTTAANLKGLHRAVGPLSTTASYHATLGNYGWAEYWITVRADAEQLDCILLWHSAIPSGGFTFNQAKIETVAGLKWTPTLPDPACASPILVKPDNHVIPAQMGRPFRFVVHPIGVAPSPEYVGTSDWSNGGFLPSSFPVPNSPGNYAADLADAKWRLSTLQPAVDLEPNPVSFLWPASGVYTNGAGGGIDRYPLYGGRWAGSHGDPDALHYFFIEQLRGQSRARIRLANDGRTLAIASMPVSWSFWDGFLNGRDAPWEWDSYNPASGRYNPQVFLDHDTASMMRRLNENWALVWLANDPLAKLLTQEGATRGYLTFPSFTVPQAGMGSDIGSWQANAMLAIAAAKALGDSQYDTVINQFLEHLRVGQMSSGCFVARQGGYPSDREPFFGQYLLQGAAEFVYLQLAAYSLGGHDIVRRASRGMVGIATDDGIHLWGEAPPGLYYYAPTGYVYPPGVRFDSAATWPWALDWTMGQSITGASYYTCWDMAAGIAMAYATNAPEAPELLRRYLAGAGPLPPNPLGIMTSWGLEAPDTQTRTPFEQFWPLIGVLQ